MWCYPEYKRENFFGNLTFRSKLKTYRNMLILIQILKLRSLFFLVFPTYNPPIPFFVFWGFFPLLFFLELTFCGKSVLEELGQ